jgi:hypothetical protein
VKAEKFRSKILNLTKSRPLNVSTAYLGDYEVLQTFLISTFLNFFLGSDQQCLMKRGTKRKNSSPNVDEEQQKKPKTSTDSVDQASLPDDILLQIFPLLERDNIIQCTKVCRQWHRAGQRKSFSGRKCWISLLGSGLFRGNFKFVPLFRLFQALSYNNNHRHQIGWLLCLYNVFRS